MGNKKMGKIRNTDKYFYILYGLNDKPIMCEDKLQEISKKLYNDKHTLAEVLSREKRLHKEELDQSFYSYLNEEEGIVECSVKMGSIKNGEYTIYKFWEEKIKK
jgi:hypothetical protein